MQGEGCDAKDGQADQDRPVSEYGLFIYKEMDGTVVVGWNPGEADPDASLVGTRGINSERSRDLSGRWGAGVAGRCADSCPQKYPALEEASRLIGPGVVNHDNNGPIAARRDRLGRVLLPQRTSSKSRVCRYKVLGVPVCRCVLRQGQPRRRLDNGERYRVSWAVACSVATPAVSTLAAALRTVPR